MENKKLIIASVSIIVVSALVNLVISNMIFIKKNDLKISGSAVNQTAPSRAINTVKGDNASTSADSLIIENIKTVTGQATTEDFRPIVSGNVISGVATGTEQKFIKTENSSPSSVVIPAAGDFQTEMNSARK